MNLAEYINKEPLTNIAALANSYKRALPFKHIVIENFLTEQFAIQLLNQFPAFEKGNNIGDDGLPGRKSTFENISKLGGFYRTLDDVIKSEDFLQLISKITDIEYLLYDSFYLGGGTHENRDGQSLHAHVDFNYHPSEGWHRRLNLIVYLNRDWDENWGGNLELYSDPYKDPKPTVRIAPLFNRCVIFETTEKSWHAFDRITLPAQIPGTSRKSIALYFYTKERPPAETAGKHTTHYVNKQLPERVAPGYTLSTTDVALLHEIISDRDDLLRRLYAENSALRQAQDKGLSGKLIYLLKKAFVRFRRW